jgi:hypothetical protein
LQLQTGVVGVLDWQSHRGLLFETVLHIEDASSSDPPIPVPVGIKLGHDGAPSYDLFVQVAEGETEQI